MLRRIGDCQSGSWQKGTGSSGSIGGWRFQISGYAGYWFTGTGSYTSGTGTFSGSLICDPSSYGPQCGSAGNYWCGSDASCAGGYGSYVNGSAVGNVIGAAALPIVNVTQKW